MSNPYPQPPLYLPPPNCFTCGNPTSHLWLDYCIRMNNVTDGADTVLPVRAISDEDLIKNSSKAVEGKILDEMGVIRYCCRNVILSQPKEQDKVPLPLKEWEKF